MQSVYITPESKLTSIDFDPFVEGDISVTTPVVVPDSKLIAVDFDPFIDGEILLTAPATASQQEIWLGVQMSREANLACLLSQSLRFKGRLNLQALQIAFQQLVARHEALRTTFSSDGTIVSIAKKVEFQSPIVDLSNLSNEEREIEIDRHQQQAVSQVFDLKHGPLFSIEILKLDDNEHIAILTVHHIICDGWSYGILIGELAQIYSALNTGTAIELEPVEYLSEYAFLEQEKSSSSETIATEAYWVEKFTNLPPILDLPVDYPHPPIRTFDSACEDYLLRADLVRDLKQLGVKNSCSLMTTLLAAFEVFLYKITGQTEFTVGVPTSGQTATGKYNLVGHCVNFLPLRSRIEPDWEFGEYLRSRNREILDDYDRQDFTFGSLLKKLAIPRNASRIPLISAVFNIDLDGTNRSHFDGLTVEVSPNRNAFATFEFSINAVTAADGQIQLNCQYNPKLFKVETIRRRLSEFDNLLTTLTQTADRSISSLSLLSTKAERQLLVEWNQTQTNYPQTCIHQLFEEQVKRTPDATAAIFGQQELTYQQLDCQADRLADYLRTVGVKPDVLVGICVERSLEMVVGLLGILKAGGAYVPLDPAYPKERLGYVLSDAGVAVLLTQQKLLSSLPSHSALVVCLDTDWSIAQIGDSNPAQVVTPENLAYVIYTSGSTGQPKGVAMNHAPLVNLIRWQLQASYATVGTRTGQFTSIGFDVSFQEIFSTWCSGGILVLIPEDVRREGILLLKMLAQSSIERLFLPFVALEQLAQSATNTSSLPEHLRELITAGEQLQITPMLAAFLQKLPNCRLENQYGPTESHVVTAFSVGELGSVSSIPPIGRPIANTQIYILDPNLQPVPIGVAGELYIGGDGLARGYFNRPELTQTKFIPNPFAAEKSARLYKTGDLARYLSDGNIEFLGRIDNQVKIRGFRIELGEIESVLSSHPQIKQAVAIAVNAPEGDKYLAAYVVEQDSSNLTNRDLREFLKAKLPDYMIPAAFVVLDALPLTPNGKVDRRALPVPNRGGDRDREYVAPRTEDEQLIANIFANILGIENVGIHDNFFELGGHSLLATQLISRIRQTFEVEIYLRTVFESSSVAQLKQTIDQLRIETQGLSLPKIERIAPDTDKIPLSSAQERLWFIEQLEGASAIYNMPIAIGLTGVLNLDAFQQSLAEIVRRHEILRTSFVIVNDTPVQMIHPSASMKVETVYLQHLEQNERELFLQQQIQISAITPFDLEIAPLVRCSLFQSSDNDHLFCLNMHHIVSDGWSIGLFLQELSVLYPAYCAGEISPLPALEVQYADFALWQRQYLSGTVLKQQLEYWVSQLQGAPKLLQLPTDRSRPNTQSYRGATQKCTLDRELTQKLQALSRQKSSTLFMTLLAVFATLLYRYSGQSDILIGSPIANRNRCEIEPLIGFFVNTLVLRTRFEDNLSFEQLLEQLRSTTIAAYEHQDLPFQQIVEALKPERSMSYSPLFQVMFALQNVNGEIELPGITATEFNSPNTIAKFDLTLSMRESSLGLDCEWEYNTDLFDGTTIERMASHFENLLLAIVANPQQMVSELPLLNAPERSQMLQEWNDTEREYPHQCIHQLFEEQVERTPDAIAVIFKEQQLTYRELNDRAARLSAYLQAQGVGSNVLVGLYAERSLNMVVGLWGILKAGGAYVPLDPAHPQKRIEYIINDSQIKITVGDPQLLASLPKHQLAVSLESNWDENEYISSSNPAKSHPEDLAYVIYTSGSTGNPKGVEVCHQSQINLLNHLQYSPGLTSADTLLAVTTICFDTSTVDMYLPLIVGAKIVLVDSQIAADGFQLLSTLKNSGATFMQATPASFRLLLAAGWEGSPQMKIISTGEALPRNLADILRSKVAEVWDFYGPTETTVWATGSNINELRQVSNFQGAIELIGKPLGNTQTYILDRYLQPVPIGIQGELHIGGDCLAKGYLNRPELTAEKFIPNPFSDKSNARLYKTGDLARYLPDGNIEYIDRIDSQVKIRGFRIELGEIESVLSSHPQIKQAVAIAIDDRDRGDKYLAAYVIQQDSSNLTNRDLREFLKAKLPDYMIPATFVMLDTLPLTPNGKIDRRALPAPEDNRQASRDTFVPPRNDLELQLTKIWERVLGIHPIGIMDNFFELGGHSLMAVKLVTEIEKTFGKTILLSTFFQSQTIEDIATILIREKSAPTTWTSLVEIQTSNSPKAPLFCIHALWGNILFYREFIEHLEIDRRVYGLQSRGLDGKCKPCISIPEMAANYIQEIQSVQPYGPYLLLGFSLGGLIAFEIARQLQAQGQEIELLALVDPSEPNLANSNLDSTITPEKSMLAKFASHWQILGDLNLEDKISYLKEQLEWNFTIGKANIFYKAYLSYIKRSAIELRLIEIVLANNLAQTSYMPQHPYVGQIALFKAEEPGIGNQDNANSKWQFLATEELEIYLVPGSHLNVMKEPNLGILCAKFKSRLDSEENSVSPS
jgi:amino acid adenylation domain-containing protein